MGTPANFAAGHHVMQLYDSENSLAVQIATFFARGLRAGDPVVMISSPHKFHLVTRHLRFEGLGVASDDVQRIQFVDAEAVLARILDLPNVVDSQQMFDDLLTTVRGGRRRATIWIYDDVVDLLCKQRNHEAAIRLEEIANSQRSKHAPIAIFCAYAVTNFDEYEKQLSSICRQHTHVIPAYGFADRLCECTALEPVVLLQQHARASGRARAREPSENLDGATAIYLIDDEASVRQSLARLLAQLTFPVNTYATAEEFLAQADATANGCLILDVHLPGMTGPELQSLLEGARWSLPVIAISGSIDPEIESEALRQGARVFLSKPFDAKTLVDAVGHVLAGIGDSESGVL